MPYSSPTRGEANAQTFLDALEPIECIICHEEYGESHQPVTLPECKHVFGLPCLRTWIRSPNRGHNRCPSCRAVLFDDGLVPVDNVGAVPQQLAGRLMALAQSRTTFSTWLGEVQQELDRLESRYPSRPRHTRNEPHESRPATEGNYGASTQEGTGEVVQPGTEASEDEAAMRCEVDEMNILRDRLDVLEVRMHDRRGLGHTGTSSSRVRTLPSSTSVQR